jgi:hypothetical protein
MAGNLVDDRPGDLRAFGQPNKEGYVERDAPAEDIAEDINQEAVAEEAAPQAPSGPEIDQVLEARREEEEPAEQEEEEGEAEELDEHQALLQRVRGRTGEAEESEESAATISEREFYQQKGRLEALEEQIKNQTTAQPKPQPDPAPEEDDGINYQDPAIVAAIRDAVENPERLGPTIQAITQVEIERAVKSKIEPIKSQITEAEERREVERAQAAVTDRIELALQQASKLGGLEAAIVADARENLQGSMLYEYLEENPALAMSPEGIVTGVIATARVAQLLDEREPAGETERPSAPAMSSGRGTTASKRGANIKKPKSELSPEDAVKQEILAQKNRGHKKLAWMK